MSAGPFCALTAPRVCLYFKSALHLSASCSGYWYSRLQRNKPEKMPRKNPPDFNFDWESRKFEPSPKSEIVPYVRRFEGFDRLSPNQVLAFTWGLQESSADYSHQLGRFMKGFDLHPADDSLLARVLRMSFQLRYYKAILKKYPRSLPLRGITESLVQRRMRLLRRLRALDMAGYKKAIEVLQISGAKHIDPYDLPTDTEQEIRKRNAKEECYQRRLSKLAQLKRTLAVKKEEFYSQKVIELNRLVDLLAQLDCNADISLENPPQDTSSEGKSEALVKLKRLFELVVAERKVDTLAPTRAGSLWWYSKEAVLREHVANSIAEREAQHLRQRRQK